jgi:hypothetical protein
MTYIGYLFLKPDGWQVLLAALLAPLPWCLALCLLRRRRTGDLDLPALLGTHVVGCLLLEGVALLRVLGPIERRSFIRFEAAVFTAGLLLLGLVVRRLAAPEGRRAFLARAGLAYGLFVAIVCGCGLLAVSFGKDYTFDLINYHYYNAHALLGNRWKLDVQAAGRETFLNPLLDVPAYLLINSVPPVWVGFVTGAVHGCAIVLLFAIAYRVLGWSPELRRLRLVLAMLCTAAGAWEPVFLSTVGTAFNDVILGCFTLGALHLLLGSWPADGVSWRRGLFAGALLLGAGIGCKLAHATFGVSFLVALFAVVPTWRRKLAVCGTWAVCLAVGFLLTDGWWMARLWKRFHNPMFPYYNNVFHSPYWLNVPLPSGGKFPENWTERLFYPFYFLTEQMRVMEAPFRDARFSVLYVLLLAAGAGLLVRALARRTGPPLFDPPQAFVGCFLVVFVVASYAIWQLLFCVYRYLVPVNLLAPLLAVLLCAYLLRRRAAVLIAAAVVCGGIALWVHTPEYGHVRWEKAAQFGHTPWAANYFPVRRPALDPAQEGLVLLNYAWDTGVEGPYTAYVTAFPPRLRFVKICGPLIESPGDPAQPPLWLHQEVQALVDRYDGPMFLLTPRGGIDYSQRLLQSYHLRMEGEVPGGVTSGWDDILMIRVGRVPRT